MQIPLPSQSQQIPGAKTATAGRATMRAAAPIALHGFKAVIRGYQDLATPLRAVPGP